MQISKPPCPKLLDYTSPESILWLSKRPSLNKSTTLTIKILLWLLLSITMNLPSHLTLIMHNNNQSPTTTYFCKSITKISFITLFPSSLKAKKYLLLSTEMLSLLYLKHLLYLRSHSPPYKSKCRPKIEPISTPLSKLPTLLSESTAIKSHRESILITYKSKTTINPPAQLTARDSVKWTFQI